jgi:hypothetical protein
MAALESGPSEPVVERCPGGPGQDHEIVKTVTL